MSALWPVQDAAAVRWAASAALKALIGDPVRMYDGRAPQGAAKPHVVVSNQTDVPRNLLTKAGSSSTLTVVAVTPPESDGAQAALAIVAAMDAAVATPLTIAGYGGARMRPEFLEVLVEEDGTRRAPRRYRVTTFKS